MRDQWDSLFLRSSRSKDLLIHIRGSLMSRLTVRREARRASAAGFLTYEHLTETL